MCKRADEVTNFDSEETPFPASVKFIDGKKPIKSKTTTKKQKTLTLGLLGEKTNRGNKGLTLICKRYKAFLKDNKQLQ